MSTELRFPPPEARNNTRNVKGISSQGYIWSTLDHDNNLNYGLKEIES
jgi:hypothetical protein